MRTSRGILCSEQDLLVGVLDEMTYASWMIETWFSKQTSKKQIRPEQASTDIVSDTTRLGSVPSKLLVEYPKWHSQS